MADWEQELRASSRARELDHPALVDDVQEILDDLARTIAGESRAASDLSADVDTHVLQRIEHGFGLSHLIREYATLRTCILRLWHREHPSLSIAEVTDFLGGLDLAVERSAERYFRLRSKLSDAFEKIATAAVESADLDAFLDRLLHIFKATVPSVDTLQILLRDGDRLRARAAIGLEEEVRQGFSVRIGEGFAGTVAATRAPLLLHDAAHDALAVSPILRAHGTRALYGVPLLDDDYVVGVAHVGSVVAHDLPDAEKRLFHAVAQRATSAILKQSFRYAAESRAAELEAVIQSIPDPVFVGDEHRILIANRAELEMLGMRSMEELRQTPLQALLDRIQVRDAATGERTPFERHPYARALHGERAVSELVFRHPSTDRDVHVRMIAAPVVVSGRIVAVVGVVTDITERKALEKERDDFLNAVVHDLRNPLTAIRGSAQTAARKAEQSGRDDLVAIAHRIERNSDGLNRMLSDLLDVTLAASGRLPIARRLVRLDELLAEIATGWSAASPLHEIEARLAPDVHAIVDPMRIRQVVENLLSNAIKYSPRGGRIVVSLDASGPAARVSVSDEGIGIRDEDRSRIFERYARGQPETTVHGHGLGLFVAHEIVKAHGGALEVESTPGEGSTFSFALPIARADETEDSTIRIRRDDLRRHG